jgi:thiol:disulfide interchange protein DsbD
MGMRSFLGSVSGHKLWHIGRHNWWRPRSSTSSRAERATKLIVCLALVTLAGFTAVTSAQDGAYPRAASVLQPQAYVSLAPVPREHAFEVAVVAKITPGFHVNAHEPSEEYLIPTKVTAELPPGIVLVETTYPRGVMRTLRFSKTPLRVYETSFTVRMKLRASGSAPLGHKKIALTIGYQPCNQDACLPPTKLPVTAELEIAAADTSAHSVNTDIFSPMPAVKFPSQH